MSDLIERDKIYEAVYDLACKSAGVIGGIGEDCACGLREAAHMIEEAPAVEAVPAVRGCHCRARSVFEATGHTETVDAAQVGHVRWRQEDAYTWVCTACGHKQIFLEGGPAENDRCPYCGVEICINQKLSNPCDFCGHVEKKEGRSMKLYKGFNPDMTCRGYQFEENKTYTHEGKVKLCKSGFHACKNPLDCFAYYNPAESVYHEVEMEDMSDERKDDSKVVGKVIKIGARLSIGKMAQAAVDYSSRHVDKTKQQQVMAGDYPTVSNTEFCSVANSTEFCSTASNTGNCSVSNNMGTCSVASNTGNHSVANNTGFRSATSVTGFRSAASNAGDYSVASSIGNRSTAEVSGNQSVAIAMGRDSKARGAKGCWIACAEWDDDGIKDVQCAYVDGETIKADVWYTLSEGKFVEV